MPIVTTSSRKRPRRSAALPIAIAAIVLVTAVVIIALRKSSSSPTPVVESPVGPNAATNADETASVDSDAEEKTNPLRITRPLHSPMVIRPGQRGEPHELPLARTGAVVRAVAGGTGITPSTNVISRGKAIFHNKTEQFIYKYANSARRPMMLMPRFGADSEEEVRKILETDIVVYDDDDEETVAVKENVAALKQDLLKAIEEGYSAAEVLNEMREDNNRRVRNRFRMQRELNSLLKSNMVDQAVEYFNAANEQLADDFLPPLVFSEDNLPARR